MAKRCVALALLLALLCTGPAALAQSSPARQEMERTLRDLGMRPLVQALLRELAAGSRRDSVLQAGDWLLHSRGVAMRIPQGMRRVQRRGSDILLIADECQSESFQTNIVLTVTDADNALLTQTEDSITRRFRGQFSNFELLAMARGALPQAADGIRIAFLAEQSPQLYMQLSLLNRGGHCFLITLSMERQTLPLLEGFALYETLCASLIFLQ